MSEDDESESEHLMTEVYADYGGWLLLPAASLVFTLFLPFSLGLVKGSSRCISRSADSACLSRSWKLPSISFPLTMLNIAPI